MTSVLPCPPQYSRTVVIVNEGMFIQIRNESEKAKIIFQQRRGALVYHLE